jgi:hypothetical protein
LDDNELRGLLPSEIGLLSNLEYLDFQRNILTGEIPEELGELTRLGKFCDTRLLLDLVAFSFLHYRPSSMKQIISMGMTTDLRAHSTPPFPR